MALIDLQRKADFLHLHFIQIIVENTEKIKYISFLKFILENCLNSSCMEKI